MKYRNKSINGIQIKEKKLREKFIQTIRNIINLNNPTIIITCMIIINLTYQVINRN